MGWRAFTRDGEELTEEKHGRPVQSGEDGKLAVIAQEDYGRTVAIDLINGVIALDYTYLGVQNGTVELQNPKEIIYICEDTHIAGELFDLEQGEPDSQGWFEQKIIPLIWRPIWFSRVTNGIPTKIVGAQTTLPEVYGGHNVKKMVMIFPPRAEYGEQVGRIGIY